MPSSVFGMQLKSMKAVILHGQVRLGIEHEEFIN